MDSKVEIPKHVEPAVKVQAYHAPRLHVYGSIKELTTANVGTNVENVNNPNNPNRRP